MPFHKSDAQRTLTLLEDYRTRISLSGDKTLQTAVDNVIKIFRSKLFAGLVDIQEFYETTLLDDNTPAHDKTTATLSLAHLWDPNVAVPNGPEADELYARPATEPARAKPPPELQPQGSSAPRPSTKAVAVPPAATASARPPPPASMVHKTAPVELRAPHQLQQQSPPRGAAFDATDSRPKSTATPVLGIEEWEYLEIHLKKGDAGLGFSIAGGSDMPHVDGDPSIYITKIIPGGAAALDGQMRVNDIIVAVNGEVVENCCHQDAVAALKKAGREVTLQMKRSKGPVENVIEIHLVKGSRGLGFSIAGGVGNQHVPGDDGIFITKIIPGGAAEQEGTLQVGDRLINVNGVSLDSVTHEEAVNSLKAVKDNVTLVIVKSDYQPAEHVDDAAAAAAASAEPSSDEPKPAQGSPSSSER